MNLGKPPNTFFSQNFFVQDRRNDCPLSWIAAAAPPWGKPSNLWIPCVYSLEYELDELNTPHTGITFSRLQYWLCRLRCKITLRHLATSPLGNIFWRHSRFSSKQPEPQTHGWLQSFLSSNGKHDFCYTMANISPSHIQQFPNLTMHFSLRHLATKILSQLYNNFISFPYFFPYYEICSINVNPLFHAVIKTFI